MTPQLLTAADLDIDQQIKLLKRRKAKLIKLAQLQTEVSAMEKNCMGNVAAIQIVTQIVCEKFSLTFERMTAHARQPSVVLPRQIAFYLIRELAEIPFAQIGSAFRKDHSTVVHGVESLRNRIDTEPKFASMVQDLRCAAQARLAHE